MMDERPARTRWTRSRLSGICPAPFSTVSLSSQQSVEREICKLRIIEASGYGHIAPKTMWGQIATMVYAVFGLPIFMLWLSNVGTLLAQTFTFLYANVCCFVCRRGKRKKGVSGENRLTMIIQLEIFREKA